MASIHMACFQAPRCELHVPKDVYHLIRCLSCYTRAAPSLHINAVVPRLLDMGADIGVSPEETIFSSLLLEKSAPGGEVQQRPHFKHELRVVGGLHAS